MCVCVLRVVKKIPFSKKLNLHTLSENKLGITSFGILNQSTSIDTPWSRFQEFYRRGLTLSCVKVIRVQ